MAIVSGEPVPPDTSLPQAWLDESDHVGPQTMSDGAEVSFSRFEHGYDPASALDRAILATRRAVFPDLGLDPEF
jgi:acetoin utilization protein AcuC